MATTGEIGAMSLDLPVQTLKGVGTERAKLLAKLNIFSVGDLLFHFPHRYEDRSQMVPLGQVATGQEGTFWGEVLALEELKPRSNLFILKVLISDGTGGAYAIWYNQPYLKRLIYPGDRLIVTGRMDVKYWEKNITVEDFEKLGSSEDPKEAGVIVPIYRLTEGISKRMLRQLVRRTVEQHGEEVPDTLPAFIKTHYKLPSTAEALRQIHCPDSLQEGEKARKTLAYEELLIWQIGLLGERYRGEEKTGVIHQRTGTLTKGYLKQLSFSLTSAQKRVLKEVYDDMEQDRPMARLLQGDVGSGKTVVAVLALLKGIDNGFQGALMVPTEILAEQHFFNIRQHLKILGVNSALLTGSMSKEKKAQVQYGLQTGEIQLIIGTHALIQDEIKFYNLGLVVIDEQHRFGVVQRGQLLAKGSQYPDLLVMTATPIPRTLALTFYGDLDFSIIDELPAGRLPVTTKYIAENKREQAYDFIKDQLDQGRQAYVVCPLVEDSDQVEGEAAAKIFEELRFGSFRNYRLGLIYGRMSGAEKERIMGEFRRKELDLLVATTVIEVGVDVANATMMLINGCERFGLAQLHQLRGRVGRGDARSYCFLMGRLKSKDAQSRVKTMLNYDDGFSIAEEDLKLRGPGDFFGVRQHGMPEFKAANLLQDYKILQLAQKDARIIMKNSEKPACRGLLKKAQKKYRDFFP